MKKDLSLSTPIRIGLGLALSVISGLAFTLAFPPFEIWPLVFIGSVPMLIAQYRIMPPKLSALASAVTVGVWMQGYLGPVFAPVGTFMVWLPLIAAGISLLTDGSQRSFNAKTGYRWFVLVGMANWAGSEMIRLFLPVAGSWAFIAYPLYRQIWLIQPVGIFGIIGLGALIMLVNHVLALAVLRWFDSCWVLAENESEIAPGLLKRWTVVGGVSILLWVGISLVLVNIPLGTPSLKVAAIQPHASPVLSANAGNNELVTGLLERMKEQTREAAMQGAQLVAWPEASFLWDPQVEDRLDLRGLTAETGVYLETGYIVTMGEKGFRNESTILSPEGKFLGIFGKDHPVTFGGETSLSRGMYPVYETPLGKLGTIICYDLDYTDTTRKLALQGAQLVAVPSNDWGSIADKHFTHAVFRAVENRVAIVKADGSFDSAIIDPYGRILALASYPQGGEAILVSDVQLGTGKGTLTTLLGDWAGWLGLAGMIFFGFGAGWLEKRALKA